MESLWGEEFTIKETPLRTKKLVEKINKPKQVKVVTEKAIKSKNVSIEDKLRLIYSEVDRILGHYKEDTICIRDKSTLIEYFDKAISNGIIAIDTETNNSLDPIICKLMGPCIYTPGMKNAYIPINHVDREGNLLSDQLTERDFREQLDRLSDCKIIMHNGKFDYEVIKCTCDGMELNIYWDTMIAAKILDENESVALKFQYIDKIDPLQEKYDIEHLFRDIEYARVDPDVFALYAATDAFMTYKLYLWQKEQFYKSDNKRLYDLFMNIEMPVVQVAAEMEITGITIDKEYANRLSRKYYNLVDNVRQKISNILNEYQPVISEWRKTEAANFHPVSKKANKDGEYKLQKSKNEQLADPPLLSSATQLAILLYDVLQVPVIDSKSPRGTGEDILLKIDNPLCKLILEQRRLDKLISTYIDKLPNCICEKDGKLHAHFNQIGTHTGRFSSSDPNLQNIPSHNKEIRLMFKASEGNVFVGSDFSQQEPRLLSQYSQDNTMIEAYKSGKDLYATVASGVYNNSYWDNMEHYEDGTPNPAGKKRRSNCKSLLLGIMYGRGSASIAEQIRSSISEAQKIIDDFYTTFPKVKQWINITTRDARSDGYVEDLWGRRRRLPDIQLPKYTVRYKKGSVEFNPLLGSKGIINNNDIIQKYCNLLSKQKSRREYDTIKRDADKEGITIVDNGAFVAQAERQCVNARIQGAAASMSKLAMRKVFDNEELKKLNFKIVLQIHDELIGECPEENAERASNILVDIMSHCAEPVVQVPFKCDAEISPCWYYNDFKDLLQEQFTEKVVGGVSKDIVFNQFKEEHVELTEQQLVDFLQDVL